jgi:hypothetical protein
MRPFSFFRGITEARVINIGMTLDELVERYDGASWMYGRIENLYQYNYEIIEENHYGIHSFLNQFESWFVITIISITGPDGFVHNSDNEGTGWGFDITSDLITIEWVRFIN